MSSSSSPAFMTQRGSSDADRRTPALASRGRWPKSEKKPALLRYQLNAAGDCKKVVERRKYGSLGAASNVRDAALCGRAGCG